MIQYSRLAPAHINLPKTRSARYTLRNHAKLKPKLNMFGRLIQNLLDSSSKGIDLHIRIPVKGKKWNPLKLKRNNNNNNNNMHVHHYSYVMAT